MKQKALIGLFIMAVGLGVTVNLTGRSAETRKEAAGNEVCGCQKATGCYGYEGGMRIDPNARYFDPCIGCVQCKDKVRGEGLARVNIDTVFTCVPLNNKRITWGEFCEKPDVYSVCTNLGLEVCQCCNIDGWSPTYGRTDKCTVGSCGIPTATLTPTPTITQTPTPTLTPTPTEVPKNWQKTCKSVNVGEIIHPECKFRCEQIKTNYVGPDKWGGDYNCDGILSGGDFSVWRNEAIDGEYVEGRVDADGTCDGRSTVADYSRWREELLKQFLITNF